MECYNCNAQLVWGGDHECDEDREDFIIETNLSCHKCGTEVIVYTPRQGGIE